MTSAHSSVHHPREEEADNVATHPPPPLCTLALEAGVASSGALALVADADQGGGSDVAVADDALPVALLAQPAQRDAALLAAHDEVGVVLGHRVGRGEGCEEG